MLASLGLVSQADAISGTLSFGNQERLELGIPLVASSKLLLLDEPTAGMPPLRQWSQFSCSSASPRSVS